MNLKEFSTAELEEMLDCVCKLVTKIQGKHSFEEAAYNSKYFCTMVDMQLQIFAELKNK